MYAAFPEVQITGLQVADAKATVEKESDKFQDKVQKKLDEYSTKLNRMEAKAKDLGEKAKQEAREEMQEMRRKMDVAEQKLKSMKSATGESWKKMKSEVNSAMESVEETYKKVADHFK